MEGFRLDGSQARVVVLLNEDEKRRVTRVAAADGRSVSGFVRQLIIAALRAADADGGSRA